MALIMLYASAQMVCTLPVFRALKLMLKSIGLMDEIGWFYQFNEDNANNGNYCNPPWGFLATSESGLAGFTCG